MPHFVLAVAVMLYALAPSAAWPADIVIINNGGAPPTPANIIDASNRYPTVDFVVVQNAGCDLTVDSPCYAPGAPTTVRVASGATVGSVLGNGTVRVFETSVLTMTGGEVNQIHLSDASEVMVSGGTVNGPPYAQGTSHLVVIGGLLRGGVTATGSSTATISGGVLSKNPYSTSGKAFIGAFNSSTVTIVGTDFSLDGSAVGYGAIPSKNGLLTGVLLSGDPLDAYLGGDATGSIVLAPMIPVAEPGSTLLLSFAVIGLVSVWHKSHASKSTECL